ncbi:MAG: Fe-S-containing protein [Melioribacteraceae bacterium]|nr:Fe-S-containing protein [Melioribacteraceae bacterium]
MANFCINCGNDLNQETKFCGSCGEKIAPSENNSNQKRDAVLGKKSTKSQQLNVVLALVLFGIIVGYFVTTETKEEKTINNQPVISESLSYPNYPTLLAEVSVDVKNGNIMLPLDVVQNKKFVSFTYNGKNGSVPLLAYITQEGKLVTAIRMCEPCDSRSFHIVGDNLVCDACGTTWHIDNLDAVSGSCGKYPPDPIPSRVKGNKIIISVSAVTSWTRRV